MTPHRVDGEHDIAAEVSAPLNVNLQTLKLAVERLNEVADCRNALERLDPIHIPHRIRGKEPQGCVEISATESLEAGAHTLSQLGGRGLLRHRPLSIPDRCFRS